MECEESYCFFIIYVHILLIIRIYKYRKREEKWEVRKWRQQNTQWVIVEFCIKYDNMIECRWEELT